jgi:transglutaminase-like putative cysteine protease
MKFEVSHRTTYAYRLPVVQSHHLIHLEPRALKRQKVLLHSLLIDPAPVARTDLEDSFGNAAVLLRIEDQHSEFIVHARSTIELTAPPTPSLDTSTPWEEVVQTLTRPGTDLEAVQFACRSRHAPQTAALRVFALPFFPPGRPVFAGAMDLTTKIFEDFTFDPTATDVSTPVSQVLGQRRGVCQDFAHLAIASLRSLGLSARYVSGYLLTRPPPGQPKLKGADTSHAWMSVWDPKQGWVDYDPTNGLIPSKEHITVAYGRDYEDISPISGVLLGGGDQTMTVAVDVEPQTA